MRDEISRRSVLKGLGVAAGTAAMGGRSFASTASEDRYVVDLSATDASLSEMADAMEVVYDFRDVTGNGDGIDFAVVRGSESAMPSDARYAADRDIEIEVPEREAEAMEASDNDEPLYDLQWDKQEQDITTVHRKATGEGARIGVIDDGVLGANPDTDFAHPDLPNVRDDLSANFTGDGFGPGPLNDDHGTHVAGTAAAADNGVGVVGMAPDAEVVDLRVFSGQFASFADIVAATIVGAAPEGTPLQFGFGSRAGDVFTGAGCDVVNLSLGSGPIPEGTPGLDLLVDFVSAGGQFAVAFDTLPVASAGNSGVDMDAGVVVLPAEADGYMSVGATGPIGYGWPIEGQAQNVGGLAVEKPIDVELPTEEPANYSNYGAEGVDVTAGGGNFDLDAIGSVPILRILYDLVLATTFVTDPSQPQDVPLNDYTPSFGFKAGTSFSAPNVAGFAALLFGMDEDAGPEEVRAQIESTAKQLPIGRAGETTAAGAPVNESFDGDFDGDQPSSPGAVPGRIDPREYRGEGHIDVLTAVNTFGKGKGNAGGN